MALTRRLLAAPLVLALAATPAALASTDGGATKHRRHRTWAVDVRDYYYLPARLRVHVGDRVRWTWPTTTGDSHDVFLQKGPKGVKRFESEIASTNYRYTVRFRKAGRYHVICTLHNQMRMTITVRR